MVSNRIHEIDLYTIVYDLWLKKGQVDFALIIVIAVNSFLTDCYSGHGIVLITSIK